MNELRALLLPGFGSADTVPVFLGLSAITVYVLFIARYSNIFAGMRLAFSLMAGFLVLGWLTGDFGLSSSLVMIGMIWRSFVALSAMAEWLSSD